MATKNKLLEGTPDQENREAVLLDEDKTKDDCVNPNDDWWNSVCYPDPHVSER